MARARGAYALGEEGGEGQEATQEGGQEGGEFEGEWEELPFWLCCLNDVDEERNEQKSQEGLHALGDQSQASEGWVCEPMIIDSGAASSFLAKGKLKQVKTEPASAREKARTWSSATG